MYEPMQQLVVFFMCGGRREVVLPIIGSLIVLTLRAPMLRAAPTTSINPNNWGQDPRRYTECIFGPKQQARPCRVPIIVLWIGDIPRLFGIYDLGPISRVSTNAADNRRQLMSTSQMGPPLI